MSSLSAEMMIKMIKNKIIFFKEFNVIVSAYINRLDSYLIRHWVKISNSIETPFENNIKYLRNESNLIRLLIGDP